MPRLPRLDAPGLLHHVIARGIEKRNIFQGKIDYEDFLSRVDHARERSPAQIFAWALMPNHFHFLIRSGQRGIAPFMRCLLTGYAVTFNKRHNRAGHLFQNRYKSIVCDEDSYFLELVRYIHLNPFRAGLVKNLEDLADYQYAGHGVLLGRRKNPWQDTEYVLGQFGKNIGEGRKRYLTYIKEGLGQGRRPELVGGGLIRSQGGWREVLRNRATHQREMGDSRVLGPGHFVQAVLERVDVREPDGKVDSLEAMSKRVSRDLGIGESSLFHRGRAMQQSHAKSLFIFLGIEFCKRSRDEMATLTKMSGPAASKARVRGEKMFRLKGGEKWLKVT